MNVRRLTLVVGLASGFVGLVLVESPAIAAFVRLPDVVLTLSLVLVGLAALVLAAGSALDGLRLQSDTDDGRSSTFETLPDVEGRPQYSRPGTAFVSQLEEIEWSDRRDDEPADRVALQSQLREMAVEVLSQTKGLSRSEIEARLDDGTWTENPRAAAFFAEAVVPPVSKREYFRTLVTSEPPFARRARHAMAEITSLLDDADVSTAIPFSVDTGSTPPATIRKFWPDRAGVTPQDRLSGRVRGAVVLSLIAGGLGIFVRQPGLLLIALFGIAIAGYARATSPPTVDVEITRTVTEATPDSGEDVTVSVTVQNTGDGVLPDIRLLDGVPAGLEVTDGSPRFATALRSGKRASFSYTVEATEGSHEFDPVLVVARNFAGVHERRTLASGPSTRIECAPPATPEIEFEPKSKVTVHPGHTEATIQGAGIEFHSIREYRPGDPRTRIDWNRRAKTGELATIDFLQSRLARCTVLIDAREEAYLTTARGDVSAVRRNVRAGHCIVESLLNAGVPAGVAALSPRPCWIPTGVGDGHGARIRNALASNPAFDWVPPEEDLEIDSTVSELRTRLTRDTQVVAISSMCDDEMKRIIRHLEASGRSVTVVSPDPTSSDLDCACGYAHVMRRSRLRELRNHGIPVIDWDLTDSFQEAMSRGR